MIAEIVAIGAGVGIAAGLLAVAVLVGAALDYLGALEGAITVVCVGLVIMAFVAAIGRNN